MKNHPSFVLILAALLAILAGPVPAAHAQSHLVRATPGLDSTINLPPTEVRLSFDHPLLAAGSSLHVTDKDGKPVGRGDGHIDSADSFSLVITLPVLFEGTYTVSYTAATVGSSTILADTYTFTIDLPDPILNLAVPTNGQSFQPGPIPVRLETRFIDFNVYQTRVRLYVDGHPYREWPGLRATIDGLQPGVHEIATVLVRGDQEVPDTRTTIYVAIQRPDAADGPRAPGGSGLPTLQLTLSQLAGLAVLILTLVAAGAWLGRSVTP